MTKLFGESYGVTFQNPDFIKLEQVSALKEGRSERGGI